MSVGHRPKPLYCVRPCLLYAVILNFRNSSANRRARDARTTAGRPFFVGLLGAFSVVRAKPFRVLSKNHVWCARRLPYPCGGRGISPLVVSDDCLHVATAVTSVLAHWQSHRGTRLKSSFGSIAQLGEHLPYKQRASGSSPFVPTIMHRSYNG